MKNDMMAKALSKGPRSNIKANEPLNVLAFKAEAKHAASPNAEERNIRTVWHTDAGRSWQLNKMISRVPRPTSNSPNDRIDWATNIIRGLEEMTKNKQLYDYTFGWVGADDTDLLQADVCVSYSQGEEFTHVPLVFTIAPRNHMCGEEIAHMFDVDSRGMLITPKTEPKNPHTLINAPVTTSSAVLGMTGATTRFDFDASKVGGSQLTGINYSTTDTVGSSLGVIVPTVLSPRQLLLTLYHRVTEAEKMVVSTHHVSSDYRDGLGHAADIIKDEIAKLDALT